MDALIDRLRAAGFESADMDVLDGHPHRRRVYYIDDRLLNWKFVEYLAEDPVLRNARIPR